MTTEPMQQASESGAGNETNSLVEQIEALKAELGQVREEALRERADLDNQRKRLARDIEMARKFANEQRQSNPSSVIPTSPGHELPWTPWLDEYSFEGLFSEVQSLHQESIQQEYSHLINRGLKSGL